MKYSRFTVCVYISIVYNEIFFAEYFNSLVLVLGSWMWLQLAAIDGGVPQAAVVRLHVNLSPQATLQTTLTAKLHLLPKTKVLLNS